VRHRARRRVSHLVPANRSAAGAQRARSGALEDRAACARRRRLHDRRCRRIGDDVDAGAGARAPSREPVDWTGADRPPVRRRPGAERHTASGRRPPRRSVGCAADDDPRAVAVVVRARARRPELELRVGGRAAAAAGRDDRLHDHAVARVHGRGDVAERRAFVRRRLRALQHGMGRRPSRRTGHWRLLFPTPGVFAALRRLGAGAAAHHLAPRRGTIEVPQRGERMTRTRSITALTLSALLLSSYSVRADVRADEKTKVELAGMLGGVMKMFGGHAARDGVTATVIVKGDRKVTLDEERGQIIDLAEEKVYDLDVKKKSYKVTTFAELRRRFEEQQRKAAEQAKRSEDKSAKEKPAEPDPNAKQVEIDFDIKNTGQKKTINGFDTQEQVMTITVREKGKTLEQGGGMVLTSDMWIAPTIKAMKEVADFDVRYAQKLYGGVAAGVSPEQMAAAMAMYPMMKDALGKM